MKRIFNHKIYHPVCLGLLFMVLIPLLLTSQKSVNSNPRTDYYVPDDFATIQLAIDGVNSGDVVWVRPGNYISNIDYNGKVIAIRSTDGPEVTTITSPGGTAVKIGGSGAEITGFTITGGSASFGGGMSVSGSETLIQGNIFDGNVATSGGFGAAISVNGASPLITGNRFINNDCDSQHLAGVITVVNNSSPVIINNIIENNPCRALVLVLPVGNTPLVINNVMYGNETGIRVSTSVQSAGHIIRNNIIVNNDIGLDIENPDPLNYPTWENNLVFGNLTDYDEIPDQTGMNGNISVDPIFVDAPMSDFHIEQTSPAVDSGTNSLCPGTDFDGLTRPQGILCDIGAYEVVKQIYLPFVVNN